MITEIISSVQFSLFSYFKYFTFTTFTANYFVNRKHDQNNNLKILEMCTTISFMFENYKTIDVIKEKYEGA